MRAPAAVLLAAIASAACTESASPAPDRPATDAPSPDGAVTEAGSDVAAETFGAADVPAEPVDATAPCDLDVPTLDGATATGHLRFANLARGAGTLRFTARNLPMFREAFIEAVVPEGSASIQIPTLAVAYEVRVTGAAGQDAGVVVDVSNSDAGMLTDGAASPATACTAVVAPGELVPPVCTDVYAASGCNIVLAGSRTGDVALRQDRRLWRFPDLPMRGDDCATGRVRVVNWYAGGPSLSVDAVGGMPIARNAAYAEATGQRILPAGALRIAVRSSEGADDYGTLPAGAVLGAHTMTLHLWGEALDPSRRDVGALLLDDVPPR
jgi:hypothetical protein